MSVNDNKLKSVKVRDGLSAKQYNEILRLIKRKITGPDVAETSAGWHIRRSPKGRGEILVLNSSGFTAPAYGIAEIIDYDEDKQKLVIGRPTSVDNPNTLIIGKADIHDGAEGYIWDNKGTHQVLAPGAVADDIVGSQEDSWEGAVSASGSFLVRAVSGTDIYVAPVGGGGGGRNVSPIEIRSGTGDTYVGRVYGNGVSEVATETGVAITIIQIDGGETVPVGTFLTGMEIGDHWEADVARDY